MKRVSSLAGLRERQGIINKLMCWGGGEQAQAEESVFKGRRHIHDWEWNINKIAWGGSAREET